MAFERQVEFPPNQKEVPWIAPFMLVLSVACIVLVIILVLTVDGSFIGPWG